MRALYFVLLILIIISCNTKEPIHSDFEFSIRMEREPGRINPFYSPTSLGREVYQYIYSPLADFHPDNLQLYPILIENIPEEYDTILNGENLLVLDVDLKDDVEWSDGTLLSSKDYYFTVQMIKHPLSKISAWKPYFSALKKIELNKKDSTKFRIFFTPDYMLSKEAALTSFVMPSHIFDPEEIMQKIPIIEEGYIAQDSIEIQLLENVNESVNNKQDVVQLGPYTLIDYQTDEYLILESKENYWGDKYPDNVFLQHFPEKLIFRIVPDEFAAVNMAKEGKLDFIRMRSSARFLELQKDTSFNNDWNFYNPQIMQYYYLALNNRTEILEDKNVRMALSHLADVEDFIQNIDGGLGTRTIGHFNPAKSYYNENLEPIKYDEEKAKQILKKSGWSDSNGDGLLDKIKDGNRMTLELELLITGSQLSQNIALLFQASALRAGIKINIVTKKMSLIRKENFSNFNFDMAALSTISDASPDDPFSRWHSNNTVPGMKNIAGYESDIADKYIEEIRMTRNTSKRKVAYLNLQEVMYQDQPVIFLYSPMQKMMISKKVNPLITTKRPGYLANSFKLSE